MYNTKKAISYLRIVMVVLMAVVTIAAVMFLNSSVKTFIVDDGHSTYTVRTLSSEISEALKSVSLKSDRYKLLSTESKGKKTTVTLAYTFPVYITKGNETIEIETANATVGEILANAGFTVDEHDMVEPSVDTPVTETVYIDYADVDYVIGSYTNVIPCGTDIEYSNDYNKGVTKTVKAGVNGTEEVKYTSKVVNGETVDTVINSVTVLSKAVNGKKVVGTKKAAVITSNDVKSVSTLTPPQPIELDANGIPVNYTKHLTVGATAYTYTGHNCATGVAPQPGYIAVNPNVIPYGTKMYIVSSDGTVIYGYAVAADTGGFIKKYPNNVDLFFSTLSGCSSFGRRNVEIYILP